MRPIVIFLFLVLSVNVVRPQAFFTIIDDDAASVEAVSAIKHIADKKGIKISFAVIASTLSMKPEVCDSLLSFQQQGFHICNHSLTHKSDIWLSTSPADISYEMIESKRILDSLGFKSHDYLVYPFGKFTTEQTSLILPIARQHFKLAFNSRGGASSLQNFNRHYINRFPIRKHENLSMVKYKIEKAVEQGDWLVFLTHSNMERDFCPEYLEQVIDLCQARNIPCLTVDEAYNRIAQYRGNSPITEWQLRHEIWLFIEMHYIYALAGIALVLIAIYVLYRKCSFRK
ncbi:MAG: polysaccharide deacetylase family protein [Coprobacter sp.]|nr:polysaccharide deacetylase family protein [Coprobacter sp.]